MPKNMIKPMNVNIESYRRTQNYIMPKKNETKINPKKIFDGFSEPSKKRKKVKSNKY